MVPSTTILPVSTAKQTLSKIMQSTVIGVDTETNGKDVRDGTGQAYGVSVSNGAFSIYLPFKHINYPEENYAIEEFRSLLQNMVDTSTSVYHNAKSDKVALGTLGIDTTGRKHVCTMVASHLVDENTPMKKSLENCCNHYLKRPGKKLDRDYIDALSYFGYRRMPASLTCEYAAYDALAAFDLYQAILPKLQEEKLGKVWAQKAAVTEVLIKMESAGVQLNLDLCEEMSERGTQEMDRLRNELGGYNPMSGKDLEILLLEVLQMPILETTPTGRPCFDKHTMEDYEFLLARLNNKTAQQILAYRGWQKSVSSNYEPYLNKVSRSDWRLRCSYNQHRTKTGRLSSDSPNLQQIPKSGQKPWNGRMKQCFIAQPGYVLIEGDYKQLEGRLTASFAKEPNLLAIFTDPDRDVFDEMAEALGMERFDAKTLNYSIAYGAGIRRIQTAFGVPRSRAIEIRDNYYRTYPRLRQASNFASEYAKAHKKIPLWSGRYRHFANPKIEAHKAFNSLAQGGAADIVEQTMLRLDSEGFNNDDCRMLLQIHDSIVFEIREDLVDKYIPAIRECMERVPFFPLVPFKVDLKVWGN